MGSSVFFIGHRETTSNIVSSISDKFNAVKNTVSNIFNSIKEGIPILYETDEKEFKTNGLGPLSDAVFCLVSAERNGPYELEMTYPVTGIHYDELKNGRLIFAKPEDGAREQPFEIYAISEPIDGLVTVSAQHISYRLKELTVMPFKADSPHAAMQAIQDGIVDDHPFTFETDKITNGSMDLKVPTACRSLLGGMEGSVLDSFGGGEYEFDRFTVKLWEARGRDRGVVIPYGKNLTGSTREINTSGVYTSVVPYWQGTDENEQEIYVIGGKVESDHVGDYPFQKCVPLDLSSYWQSQPTKEQLQARAAVYLRNNTPWRPSVSVEASFVPLNKTMEYADIKSVEHVRLCDIVTIEGRDYTVKAKVIGTVYNVLREYYDSIEVGDARTTFAQEVAKNTVTEDQADRKIKSAVQRASERLSTLIQEASGMFCTEQEQPDGSVVYLLHDKKTLTESRNVIKLTAEAIGFSTDGGLTYPYGFTITGEMVARLLSANGINADWINTGVINLQLLKLIGSICGLMEGYGKTPNGQTTKGIVIYGNGVDAGGNANPPYIIVTNAGIRLQQTDEAEFNVSGGQMEMHGSLSVRATESSYGNVVADGQIYSYKDINCAQGMACGGSLSVGKGATISGGATINGDKISIGLYGSDLSDCYWRSMTDANGNTYMVLTKA